MTPIKEFVEEIIENKPLHGLNLLSKLVELESIEKWILVMYGVELEIYVKPAEVPEGRFYGKGIVEALKL